MNNATETVRMAVKTAPENSGLVKVQLSNVIDRSNKSNCWFLLSDMLEPLDTSNQIARSKHNVINIQVCHAQYHWDCHDAQKSFCTWPGIKARKLQGANKYIIILYYTIINHRSARSQLKSFLVHRALFLICMEKPGSMTGTLFFAIFSDSFCLLWGSSTIT